ncbi:MAG: hypothetical protein F6K14_16155 [Symploca sp. SIO2C1]|nr:hypothetical protein [Symploca sp. SIO2C1]
MTSPPIPQSKPIPKTNHKFILLLVSIYFLLGLVGILNHAMWRDELHVWMVGRDSDSLLELFYQMRYEGHPGLWYFCLYVVSKFTDKPVFMQILHLLLGTGFVYLFVRYSPFTRLHKVLFSFGYFSIYEYLVISKNYAIGILLLFVFCTLFERRKQDYLLLAVILLLMANTNAYCLFIATALGLNLMGEYCLSTRFGYSSTASKTNIIASLFIFILGILSSLAQIIPHADATSQGGLSGWMLQFDPQHLAAVVTRIWNSHILILVPSSRYLDLVIFAVLSLILLLFVSTLLIKKPFALFLYLFGTMEILLLTYVKFFGSLRHHGHLYILLIVALWIASYYPKSNLLIKPIKQLPKKLQQVLISWLEFVAKYKTALITIILTAQVIAGMIAFTRDFFVPYSASRETANFIQSQQLEQKFIVGSRDVAVSPIAGYLNRKIYYPESKSIWGFVRFNTQRQDVTSTEVLEQISQLIQQNQTEILLILNYELDSSRDDLSISPLAKFTKSFVDDERYYLYLVSGG